MKKRLYIVRHAEAVKGDNDKARPLSKDGQKEAHAQGARLRMKKYYPDFVICSPARRTRETFDIIGNYYPQAICIFPEYAYNATPGQLLEGLHAVPESCEAPMIIGHNPGMHMLAMSLAQRGDDVMRAELQKYFKTGMIAVIDVNCESWAVLQPEHGTLADIIVPK